MEKISTNELVKRLGLYMPRSIGNGRAFFNSEVQKLRKPDINIFL